jgi:hypothetical protein
VLDSRITTLLESVGESSHDPSGSPHAPAAGGCRGDPAASKPKHVDPIVELWRQYYPREHIAAVEAAYHRMVEDQMTPKKREK